MPKHNITCPNCGTAFTIDESGYAALLAQVRDQAFQDEVANREKLMQKAQDEAVATATAREQASAAEKNAKLEAELAQVREQLSLQRQQAATQQELAVAQALSTVEKERDDFANQVKLAEADAKQAQADHAAKLAEVEQSTQKMLQMKDEELERLRDMKARQSTKMLGESLEKHCEAEFNKVRAMAFPHATFGKDNDVVEGTKGDYIFREADENGVEFISIMFEMKNEDDTTTSKHKNEHFYKKLDADRTKKNCEYAILVSLLEADDDYFNQGIVEVTDYPKMYVIRPQFFVPIIGLLRNMARGSLADRQQLALMREHEVDVTNFEKKLEGFKAGFTKNMSQAEKKYLAAIDDIDKAIKALEKTRADLVSSNKYLGVAGDKLDNLTVRKLTWGNPTMREKFEHARNMIDVDVGTVDSESWADAEAVGSTNRSDSESDAQASQADAAIAPAGE